MNSARSSQIAAAMRSAAAWAGAGSSASAVTTTLMQGASMSASEKPANTVAAGMPSASAARAASTARSIAPWSVVLRSVWPIMGNGCQRTV